MNIKKEVFQLCRIADVMEYNVIKDLDTITLSAVKKARVKAKKEELLKRILTLSDSDVEYDLANNESMFDFSKFVEGEDN